MQVRFAHRWSLSLLLVAVLALLSSVLLSGWALHRGFDDYLMAAESERWQPFAAALAGEYRSHGWDSLRQQPERFYELLDSQGPSGALNPAVTSRRPPPGPPRRRGNSDLRPRPPPEGRPPGLQKPPPPPSLVDSEQNYVAGSRPPSQDRVPLRLPIRSDGRDVGWLLLRDPIRLSNDLADGFVRRQWQISMAIGAAMLAVFAGMAWWMAGQIGRPLDEVGRAMRRLSEGDYEHRVDSSRSDEFGELAERCNRLAARLAQARDTQRRWLADIAHELRTPLTIMRGELQAVEDGVRPADERWRASLEAEALRLSSLVDDLRTLALADEGGLVRGLERVDLRALLEDTFDSFATRIEESGLQLDVSIGSVPVVVEADPGALQRALANLLENSCRYTDRGGSLRVRLRPIGKDAVLSIDDSTPGVPSSALPHLFERFYRVEGSRSRESGGSGLGLSIVAGIVQAHHGRITASASELGGLKLEVTLPLAFGKE